MNILFVHETEYVNKMIFEYQIIPEILSSRGHNVIVIDFPTKWDQPSGSIFHKPQSIPDVQRANKDKGITLLRPGFIKIPVLSRITAFFSYFALIEHAILAYKIECVVLYAAPTNGIQTLLMARKYHIPIYFRLLDVLHQLVPNDLLRWLTYLIEKYVYRRVDRIAAITPRLCDYAVMMGAKPEKCIYLPSGSDADLFFYQKKDKSSMTKYGLREEELVLLFAGTLYNFSGLDKIISALPQYLRSNPHLKLLIIGNGEQESKLRTLVHSLNLEKTVIFTGFVNYSDLPGYINLADICINPFEINKTTNIIFPGKIYQYLACEKPVIATKLQGMLDIFPVNDSASGIHYYDTVDEFFVIVSQINRCRVKDPNPSLQEITTIIESDLRELGSTHSVEGARA